MTHFVAQLLKSQSRQVVTTNVAIPVRSKLSYKTFQISSDSEDEGEEEEYRPKRRSKAVTSHNMNKRFSYFNDYS